MSCVQKLDRRQTTHRWAKQQGVEDYSRFDDLLIADAMSSDDTDDYENEQGLKIHGLKRSIATWRSDDASQYLAFLDRAHDNLSGKVKQQLAKPMRNGVRDSVKNKLIAQIITKHPGIAQFVNSSAQPEQAGEQPPKSEPPLQLPLLPTLKVSASFPVLPPCTSALPSFSIFHRAKSAIKKTQPPTKTSSDERNEELFHRLLHHGMKRVSNTGGGDCLYLSVLFAIKQLPALAQYGTVQSLRDLFVREALVNPDMGILGGPDSIRNHLEPGHWDDNVGDAVLQVLLKALEIKATIWTINSSEYELGDSDTPSKIVLLKLWNHWEALEPLFPSSPAPKMEEDALSQAPTQEFDQFSPPSSNSSSPRFTTASSRKRRREGANHEHTQIESD